MSHTAQPATMSHTAQPATMSHTAQPATMSPITAFGPSTADKGKGAQTGSVGETTVNFTLPSDFFDDNVLDETKLFPHLGKYQLPSFRERFSGVSLEDIESHVVGLVFMAFQASLALHAETSKVVGLMASAIEEEDAALGKEKSALERKEAMSVRLDDVLNELEAVNHTRDEVNSRLKESLTLMHDQREKLEGMKESLVMKKRKTEESKSKAVNLEKELEELKDENKSIFSYARLTARAAIIRRHLLGKSPLASASDELYLFYKEVGTERDLEKEIEEEEGLQGEASSRDATDAPPLP